MPCQTKCVQKHFKSYSNYLDISEFLLPFVHYYNFGLTELKNEKLVNWFKLFVSSQFYSHGITWWSCRSKDIFNECAKDLFRLSLLLDISTSENFTWPMIYMQTSRKWIFIIHRHKLEENSPKPLITKSKGVILNRNWETLEIKRSKLLRVSSNWLVSKIAELPKY